MARSIRDVSIASPMPIGDFNPLPPGGRITCYANADAAGDTMTIMAGGVRVCVAELGVENAAGVGPKVPDDLIAQWQNNGTTPLDIQITTTGDNDDVLLFLE